VYYIKVVMLYDWLLQYFCSYSIGPGSLDLEVYLDRNYVIVFTFQLWNVGCPVDMVDNLIQCCNIISFDVFQLAFLMRASIEHF
jgi:hypothetical protein